METTRETPWKHRVFRMTEAGKGTWVLELRADALDMLAKINGRNLSATPANVLPPGGGWGLQTKPFGPPTFLKCHHSIVHFHALPVILELRLAHMAPAQ
jgi:hypothetical protein